jgi:CRISPR-associated endonuclease/helicase Cas3
MTITPTPDDFPEFFERLWGYEPFPWQTSLAERVCAGGGWPANLDLPTASGKTAVIDIALFHLALEADRGGARRAPVRIVFVVDRRLVVDGAYERARAIARKLEAAEEGLLRTVADRLRLLSGEERPLRAVRLRGGAPVEPDWARTPSQPTILVSTVDQVGSRLLFRGYGVSDSMRPVHAGLLGSDALFFLDEAHLSQPFAETLGWIDRYRRAPWAEVEPGPFKAVHLSATLPPEAGERFPESLDADRAHERFARRLGASKPTRLVKAGARLADEEATVAGEIVDHALDLRRRDPAARRFAIVVNRVGLARAVHRQLQATLSDDDVDVDLLIGRSRPLDRDRRMRALLPRMRADESRADDERPLFVVATQSIEAGADLDFDAMVSQIAPLDCLRQRFGRLDRLGLRGTSRGVVLAAADEVGARARDPIYGEATAETWTWLSSQAAGRERTVDFGIDHLAMPEDDVLPRLLAPRASAPVMLPAYVDAFATTSPAPSADPEPALFLHGPAAAPADVQIVWRADLSPADLGDPERAREIVSACPPSSLEAIAVPLAAARRWLSHGRTAILSDLEGLAAPGEERDLARRDPTVLRWAGARGAATEAIRARDLRPGDLIVVPASLGGADVFGWDPRSAEPVADLAEEAMLRQRHRLVQRIHPGLLRRADADESEAGPSWARVAEPLEASADEPGRLAEELRAVPGWPEDIRRRLDKLSQGGVTLEWCYGEPSAGVVLRARARLRPDEVAELLGEVDEGEAGGEAATEDGTSAFGRGRPVPLLAHCRGVAALARGFAEQAGLSRGLCDDLALAAELHDLGKAEPRFQIFLHAGDELAWLAAPEPLAKGGGRTGPAAIRRAAERARLPAGARHECWSVRLAESHPRLQAAHDSDLVLWLIGTHHGRGRPFFPPMVDPQSEGRLRVDLDDGTRLETPVEHGLVRLDSGWIERFERLKRRYGAWELARLEAILRLADHRQSEGEGAA